MTKWEKRAVLIYAFRTADDQLHQAWKDGEWDIVRKLIPVLKGSQKWLHALGMDITPIWGITDRYMYGIYDEEYKELYGQ